MYAVFGDGTDESKGVDFGGDKAVEVTDYLIDLEQNPNFRIDADGSGIAGLRDGSISAIFSGSWDANAVKEALGRQHGRRGPSDIHVERRGETDDGLRRFQGDRSQSEL